jgi:asparagine synthetase B (glutamine-hydrolysing)
MCGILGVIARGGAPYDRATLQAALEILATCAQSRGKDSSGVTIRDESAGSLSVFKGDVPLGVLYHSGPVRSRINDALAAYGNGHRQSLQVMGHSRLVTNGSQLEFGNNQPVVKDGIVGIHNGIVVNDHDLWIRHGALHRNNEIDTEVLLALIRKNLSSGHSLPAAVALTDAEIKGTFSVALLFDDLAVLALATNNGSLYALTDQRDILFFASEQFPLKLVLKRLPIEARRDLEIRHLSSRTGLVLSLDSFAIEWFDFSHAEEAAVSRKVPSGRRLVIEEKSIANGANRRALVRDVAQIARAPEAHQEERLLEFNQERVGSLRRCAKCVLPETFPFIQYDEQGVCNYCRHYRLKNQPKPLAELLDLLRPYRRADGAPDCIVPFSGGRDSTFALHTIRTELGLNPIAFTYDWGMVTDLGRRNIARVCGKLGVENIIVAANIHRKRRNIRKNIEAWLRKPHLGMVPLFMAGDKYFYYYVEQVKRHTGIALNIWGINPLENTDFKVGFMGVPPDPGKKRIYSLSLARQLRLFRGAAAALASNPAYLNSSVWDTLGGFVSRSIMPHRDYFHLYDYVHWDERTIDSLLLDEYEWESAIDTGTTWRIGDGTAAFYNYIYYNVAGFSEHDTFRSNQIREGAITRDQALARLAEENRPRYATIKWYTDVVGVDYAYAIRTINAIPKLYP